MKIGIYGGTFDPIHTGHLVVANFVAQCGLVDEVWLTVNRKNPLKIQSTQALEEYRLKMAEIAVKPCPSLNVCDIELSMPYPSYTVDTLSLLKNRYPDYKFTLIIGSDSFQNFNKWKNADTIVREFGVIVYPRPGYILPQDEPVGFTFLNGAPLISMSSSLIREYVRDGWNINYFVPLKVADYIADHKLYYKK